MVDRAGMRTSAAEPDDPNTITIIGDGPYETESNMDKIAAGSADIFAKSGDKLKAFDGLNATTKRRISRRIQKARTGEGGAGSNVKTASIPTGYALFDVVEPPLNLEYLAKLYEISAPHRAAVDAKVTNIVGLGFEWNESARTQEKIARTTEEESLERLRRRVSKARREMHEWLEDTNAEDTFDEVLRKVMTDVEVTGNGYLEIGRNRRGQPGYLGHIPSVNMRRRLGRDGYVQLVTNKATFFRNFGDFDTPNPIDGESETNEIIHFMKYTPTNDFYGVPDIVAAKNALAGDEFSARFNLDYFEHKAVPRFIVTLKGASLDAASEKRLVDFFSANLKGQHHRTLFVPLPPDQANNKVEFKMEPVEAKLQEASFVKYREMNRDEILMAHRVPLPQTGYTANVSLGGTRESARMFKEQVCRPWQDVIEKKLRPIFREITDAFDFHLVELTLTDEDTASRIHERYLRWEVYVPNDVREWLGEKGRKGGDKPVGVMAQASAKNTGTTDSSEQRTQANQSRQRDQTRTNAPDSQVNTNSSRNTQGDGRRDDG